MSMSGRMDSHVFSICLVKSRNSVNFGDLVLRAQKELEARITLFEKAKPSSFERV